MTTLRQLRKTADSLPEVEEISRLGAVAFQVRGKPFASLSDDGILHLQMAAEVVAETAEEFPGGEIVTRAGAPGRGRTQGHSHPGRGTGPSRSIIRVLRPY